MIVAREDESRAHVATGAWGRVTLDQIVARNAETRPDHLALVDFADRAEWTCGAPERLTWKALDVRVEALAAFFAAVGLKSDTVVALQMPPTSDAVVALFACSRAGLIVAPLPLAAREADAAALCRRLGVRAIVTVARTEEETHGVRLRDVAADLFQIRFVFGAGGDLPDGLVDLSAVFDEAAALGAAPALGRKGNPADHAFTVEVAALADDARDESLGDAGRSLPLPRSHNHWIATGLMTLLEAGVGRDSVILSPFAPSGVVGVGVAVVPWLIAGATLALGLPRSTDVLADEAERLGATHVAAPAPHAARLADRLALRRLSPTLLAVAEEEPEDRPMPAGVDVVDVTPLGAYGLVARRRAEPSGPRPLPIGPCAAPADAPNAPVLVEIRLKAIPQRAGQMVSGRPLGGEVQLRGAMAPHFNWPTTAQERKHRPRDPEGWMATGLGARVVTAQPPTCELAGRIDETVRIGQTLYDLTVVDALYRAVDGVADAAAFLVETPETGRAVAAAVVPAPGRRFDPESFRAAIAESRVGLAEIPVRVFAVPAIARGPSGRILRSGMAQHLMTLPRAR
ncbi:MAG: AMP-binding protein [Hyphomicrobiales bacterium]|nr:AMP-binding protein [Hyphomicrobiales bacterium]